jgi:hypothetical protein
LNARYFLLAFSLEGLGIYSLESSDRNVTEKVEHSIFSRILARVEESMECLLIKEKNSLDLACTMDVIFLCEIRVGIVNWGWAWS